MKKISITGSQDVLSEEEIDDRETNSHKVGEDSGVVKFQRSESATALGAEHGLVKPAAETEVEGGNKNLETPESKATRNPQELTAEKSKQN